MFSIFVMKLERFFLVKTFKFHFWNNFQVMLEQFFFAQLETISCKTKTLPHPIEKFQLCKQCFGKASIRTYLTIVFFKDTILKKYDDHLNLNLIWLLNLKLYFLKFGCVGRNEPSNLMGCVRARSRLESAQQAGSGHVFLFFLEIFRINRPVLTTVVQLIM